MKKLLLTGSAALLLATGTHALDYRPQYDTRPWEAAEPPEPTYVPEREYGEGVDCMKLKKRALKVHQRSKRRTSLPRFFRWTV
jgi:hypothetical protein